MRTECETDVSNDVEELTPEEQEALLEREARTTLNLSAEEFTRKWRAGDFRGNEDPKVTRVAMLLPDAWS